MVGRILELTQDCLANPKRAGLIPLECLMLYPTNEEARAEAAQTAQVEAALDIARQSNGGTVPELAQIAASVTPISKIHQRISVMQGGPFVRGLIAGEILFLVLKRITENKPDASMKCVFADVARNFERAWDLSPKTIENRVWPTYRSVAHFWAAHWYFVYVQAIHGNTPSFVFPCSVDDLGLFLATAEEFRILGESTKTNQAPGMVLRAHESVRLPNLDLPKVKLDFADATVAA